MLPVVIIIGIAWYVHRQLKKTDIPAAIRDRAERRRFEDMTPDEQKELLDQLGNEEEPLPNA